MKKRLVCVITAFIMLIIAVVMDKILDNLYVNLILCLSIYLFIGNKVLVKAFKNIIKGQVFDENFLMCVASIGAFIVGDFSEAVAVMVFYQIGELFQDYAVNKSRNNITQLMNLRPDRAVVIRNGKQIEVMPEEVEIGETLLVKAGDKVAIDGLIENGESEFNTMALSGESLPLYAKQGDEVLSGYVNLSGVVYVKTTKLFEQSAVSKILELVENACTKKAKTENFITKFAKYYTPLVCLFALLLAVIPSIIWGNVSKWVFKALTFLVVSCPCALLISVPLAFFGGIGSASKKGILVKGGNCFESIDKTKTFVFDKTGTITQGKFDVLEVLPQENGNKILQNAYICECKSNHPIAKCITEYVGNGVNTQDYAIYEIAGQGIKAESKSDLILCGNEKLMAENGVRFESYDREGCLIYVAKNGEFLGVICVGDRVKTTSNSAISQLKEMGCKTYMLTGDSKSVAENIAKSVGIDDFKAKLLPNEKVSALEQIIKENDNKVCFVGDGINDAPVIMRADVGVAMGGVGSDSAIESADVVLMNDDLSCLIKLKKIAKKTLKIAKQNIVFAIAIKLLVLLLATIGISNMMWYAVFADVGVSVISILNAMRCLK